MLKHMIFCTLAITAIAFPSPPLNSSSIHLPSHPSSRAQLSANLTSLSYTPWPRVPFQALVADTVILYLSCWPIEAEESYVENILFALNELEELYYLIAPGTPLHTFHHAIDPIIFDLRVNSARPYARENVGLILGHLETMLYLHGPATVSARLMYQGHTNIGSFTLSVPFPPSPPEPDE